MELNKSGNKITEKPELLVQSFPELVQVSYKLDVVQDLTLK